MSEPLESSREPERRRSPSLIWPVVFIAAGVLLLLDVLDVVQVNWWQLWRLWPVLIILLGLDLLLARRSTAGNIIALVVTLIVVGGIVWLVVAGPMALGEDRASADAMRISEPLDDAEQVSLDVDFPAGRLTIDAQGGGDALILGTVDVAGSSQPAWVVGRSGGQVEMILAYPDGQEPSGVSLSGEEWTLHLSPQPSWDLSTSVGAAEARLDLSDLSLRSLDANAGVSQSTVVFPGQGDVRASVESGVGIVVLEIPESMAVRLHVNRALTLVDVSARYQRVGDDYVAGNWDSADNRLELDVNVAVGAITVREP